MLKTVPSPKRVARCPLFTLFIGGLFSSISLEALSVHSRLSGTLGESDSWRELSLAVGPREMILSSPSLTVLTWKVGQCSISPAELLLGESGVLPANC